MRRWQRQLLIDTMKASIPGKQHIRQVLRRVRPYEPHPGNERNLFNRFADQIELLRKAGRDIRGKRILEIGSGWHPIGAMTFLASGAATVTLTDIEWLLDPRLIRSAIEFIRRNRDCVTERLGAVDFDRLDVEDGPLAEMMRRLGLRYLVPYRTELSPDGSADLIVSSAVFEHIPTKTLELMLTDFRRILVPGGAMVHNIDYSDHYAHMDDSISRCNFLQYDDWLWRLLSLNPQAYHNRLRHSDFAAMFRRHGFQIVAEHRLTREAEQREVAAMKLASRFAGRDIKDLAAVSARFVLISP